MTNDHRDACEVIFVAIIVGFLLTGSLIIIHSVWGFEIPDYPTGTCRDAESLQEIECGKYDD